MYGLGRGQPTNAPGIPWAATHPVDAVMSMDFVSNGWLAGANPELRTSNASGTCEEACSGSDDAAASSTAAQPEIMLFSLASIYMMSGPVGALLKYFRSKSPQEKIPEKEESADQKSEVS